MTVEVKDPVDCWACVDGKVTPACGRCEGDGRLREPLPDLAEEFQREVVEPAGVDASVKAECVADCPACGGSGEGTPEECAACEGEGRLPRALAKIREAATRCEATPDRDLFSEVVPRRWAQRTSGVTGTSLAMWSRIRHEFVDKRVQVEGISEGSMAHNIVVVSTHESYEHEHQHTPATHPHGPVAAGDAAARHVHREVAAVASFDGFSWGYGGEGPHGLACLLADLGLAGSVDDALRFVASRDGARGWALP